MKHVAIIGCGYVGLALGKALVRRGCHVLGTTTSPSRCEEISAAGIVPAVVALPRAPNLPDLLSDREAVVLCAAAGRSAAYEELYVEGMRRILAACNATPIRHIVFTSSTRVYGQRDGRWVDEDTPAEPGDENGRLLLQAEQILLDACSEPETSPEPRASARADVHRRHGPTCGKPPPEDAAHAAGRCATVLRLGGIHGPGRELAKRIRAAAGQRRSGADTCVNLIHLDDIIAALLLVLDRLHAGVLNLVDDHPEPRRVLYDGLLATSGLPGVDWVRDDSDPPDLGKRVRNDRLKRVLGLQLKHARAELRMTNCE